MIGGGKKAKFERIYGAIVPLEFERGGSGSGVAWVR
jgi:hypothetical protein